jgi:hypothetical protein
VCADCDRRARQVHDQRPGSTAGVSAAQPTQTQLDLPCSGV